MSSAVPAISNSETVENANGEIFRRIKLLAGEFEKRDINAKDALYAALEALFAFVMNLETEADRRQFIEAQGGNWGKVARDNPFQPFVKLAFDGDGISDTSRSQYASVLRYAQFVRDKAMPLADWLRTSGGIDGLYKDAADFFPKPHKQVEQAKLEAAVKSIKEQRLSGKFDIQPANVTEGYVMALLHVDAKGNAHVVEYTERDQAKLDILFQKLAKAEAKKAVEAEKPLFALCRAIRLLTGIVPAGKSDTDRLITLSRQTDEDGGIAVTVRAISTAYEGALAPVPAGMSAALEGYAWARNTVGESGGVVYHLHGKPGTPDLFLKYGKDAFAGDLIDEMVRLRWLGDYVPTPAITQFAATADEAWLLMTALPGATAYQMLEDDPDGRMAVVDALAAFLRRLHAIPVSACPFNSDHGYRLRLARQRIDAGLVDEEDFDEEREGWTAEQVWKAMQDLLPFVPDPVVTHGDFSLDNLLMVDGDVVGCIDAGRVGIADRYQDIAILWNCLGEFDASLQDRFLAQYGVPEPDEGKLRFHLMLDELF